MPEHLEKLKATIRELEAELSSLDSLDVETERLLQEAIGDIQTAIQRRDPQQFETHPLSEKLTAVAEQFETSHPTLFGVVSRIVDGLGQMGI